MIARGIRSLTIVSALLVCTAQTARPENGTFKLGALLCLTGGCAEVGSNALHGAQIAADEINAEGGILGKKIEIIAQDTREAEAGSNAVTALQNLLLNPEINYVIGPTWTIGGQSTVPVLVKRQNLIITSPSLGVADFNEAADHMFNIWPHDSHSTSALARYAFERGWKRAAVFSNQGAWESNQAKAFAKEFQKLGGEIVSYMEPPVDSRDLRTEALKIKSANPDVVFMSNYTQWDISAKELQRMNFTGHKLAILMDDTRIKGSDGALEGTIFARYPEPSQEFLTKYEKRFGEKPGIAADTGYDVVKIYAQAIRWANTFDTNLVKKVIPILNYVGASGKLVFDGNGGVVKTPEFWVVKDSKQVRLEASSS